MIGQAMHQLSGARSRESLLSRPQEASRLFAVAEGHGGQDSGALSTLWSTRYRHVPERTTPSKLAEASACHGIKGNP